MPCVLYFQYLLVCGRMFKYDRCFDLRITITADRALLAEHTRQQFIILAPSPDSFSQHHPVSRNFNGLLFTNVTFNNIKPPPLEFLQPEARLGKFWMCSSPSLVPEVCAKGLPVLYGCGSPTLACHAGALLALCHLNSSPSAALEVSSEGNDSRVQAFLGPVHGGKPGFI